MCADTNPLPLWHSGKAEKKYLHARRQRGKPLFGLFGSALRLRCVRFLGREFIFDALLRHNREKVRTHTHTHTRKTDRDK